MTEGGQIGNAVRVLDVALGGQGLGLAVDEQRAVPAQLEAVAAQGVGLQRQAVDGQVERHDFGAELLEGAVQQGLAQVA